MSDNSPAVGDIVSGRYHIRRHIGRGGRGVVFAALDGSTGMEVAIKLTRYAGHKHMSELRTEAELTRQLSHDCLVPVLDSGEANEDHYFLVSKLVVGENLLAIVKRGRLSSANAAAVCMRVARAVSYLHELSILHRDIKPGNILVPKIDDTFAFDLCVLLDFGVAVNCGNEPDANMRTASGVISGTPLYMAPEQFVGRRQSPATDVYALGLVLYECLYGATPFADLPILRVMTQGGLLPKAFFGPFVTHRLTREIVIPEDPSIAPALASLLTRMLSIHPHDRPQSMHVILRELHEWIPTAVSSVQLQNGTAALTID